MKNGLLSLFAVAALSIAIPLSARQQTQSQGGFQASHGGRSTFRTEMTEPVQSGRLLAQNSSKGSTTTSTKSSTKSSSTAKSSSKSSKKSKSKSKKSGEESPFPGQYPEGSERMLTEKDMEHLTPWGMNVMLNEIYARQGLIFKDAELKKHFSNEKWYKGKQTNISKIKLTTTEKQNVAFIKAHQGKAKI